MREELSRGATTWSWEQAEGGNRPEQAFGRSVPAPGALSVHRLYRLISTNHGTNTWESQISF